MQNHDETRHPGPWRVMRLDTGLIGILIALAFVVLGLIGNPVMKWFLSGALVLGVLVFLLLRRRRNSQ